VGVMADIIAMD